MKSEMSLRAVAYNGDTRNYIYPQIDINKIPGICNSYPVGRLSVSQK